MNAEKKALMLRWLASEGVNVRDKAAVRHALRPLTWQKAGYPTPLTAELNAYMRIENKLTRIVNAICDGVNAPVNAKDAPVNAAINAWREPINAAPAKPQLMAPDERIRFSAGYDDGLDGKPAESDDLHYMRGYELGTTHRTS